MNWNWAKVKNRETMIPSHRVKRCRDCGSFIAYSTINIDGRLNGKDVFYCIWCLDAMWPDDIYGLGPIQYRAGHA